MFAIAFDLHTDVIEAAHPKGARGAYLDVEKTLGAFKFERVQGSLYTTRHEDLSNLFLAMASLKALPWFPDGVRDIRVFRIELWSDMTAFAKE